MKMSKKFKIETSWDDGSELDLKLAKMLKKYCLPATFYLPYMCELNLTQICFLSKDFEIGSHTLSHPLLTRISKKDARTATKNS